MLLETPIRTLGPVDCRTLKGAVEALPAEAWFEDTSRQDAFDQHKATQSVVLLFCSGWPEIEVERRKGWERLGAPAQALMDGIIADHYAPGGKIIRAMAAKLKAGGRIALHKDGHPSFAVAHRIHVPLQTNPDVEFVVRGAAHALREGVAYEVSNLDYHAVTNRGADRTHFIFDYIPPA